MKADRKKTSNKIAASKSSTAVEKKGPLSEKILAYCGYKLVGKKLVSTGNYNPVPYVGL